MRRDIEPIDRRGQGLVDVLDRVLDKGLVVAGDIRVALADVELLTIRIRLLVCSIDKAQEIGLDWWRHDPYLTSAARERAALPSGEARPTGQSTKSSGSSPRKRSATKQRSRKTKGGGHRAR